MCINSEKFLKEKKISIKKIYFLFGNDFFLLQKIQFFIINYAKKYKFNEYFKFIINYNTDWESLFNICSSYRLFSNNKILILILPDKYCSNLNKKMLNLFSLINSNLLLILISSNLNSIIINSNWFKIINKLLVFVNCNTPKNEELIKWVISNSKKLKLILDYNICKLLCFFYEGNLFTLNQVLNNLAIINRKTKINYSIVNKLITNNTKFMYFHWIDAILYGYSKRAIHILRQLRIASLDKLFLLRKIKCKVLLILKIKRHIISGKSFSILFYKYNIIKNRQIIYKKAITRLSLLQLNHSFIIMNQINSILKTEYTSQVWSYFDTLTLLLCGNKIPMLMIYE